MPTTVECPHCSAALILSPAVANRIVTCPRCKQQVQMPPIEATTTPEAELSPVAVSEPTSAFPNINTGRSTYSGTTKQVGMPPWLHPLLAISACIVMCCGGMRGCAQADRAHRNNQVAHDDIPDNSSDERVNPAPKIDLSVAKPNQIDANYLPHKPGAVAYYYIHMDDTGKTVIRRRQSYHNGGVIQIGITGTGQFKNGQYDFETIRMPITEDKHRINNGFVEVGTTIEDAGFVWDKKLKIGATTGDTWETRQPGNITRKCTVRKFKSRKVFDDRDRPCVVIMVEVFQGKKKFLQEEHEYVYGIGLVESTNFLIENGSGKLMGEWHLKVPRKDIATTYDEAFFE